MAKIDESAVVRDAIGRTMRDEFAWQAITELTVRGLADSQMTRAPYSTPWLAGVSSEGGLHPGLETACKGLFEQALLAARWYPLSAEEGAKLPRVMRQPASQEQREDVEARLEAQGVPADLPRAIGSIEPGWGSGGAPIVAMYHTSWWGGELYVRLQDVPDETMLKVRVIHRGTAAHELPGGRSSIVSLTIIPDGWDPLPVRTGECVVITLRQAQTGIHLVQSVVMNFTTQFASTVNRSVTADVARRLQQCISVKEAIEFGFGCATMPEPGFDDEVDRRMEARR